MLTPNRLYPHLSYEVITDVAQIIDNHLRDDWIIRVEYTEEVEYLNTSWQQWGKPFFKIKAPAEVIDNIFACHTNNQLCSIRLHAEKINPVSSFYYSVCQACHVPKNSGMHQQKRS
jgi:ribulose bisphosphate carboxylase small subunit